MTERELYEESIYNDLKNAEQTIQNLQKRLELVLQRLERDVEGSARVVPEDKTLKQDLIEIAVQARDLSENMDASMQDYNDLLDLIEEQREEEEVED